MLPRGQLPRRWVLCCSEPLRLLLLAERGAAAPGHPAVSPRLQCVCRPPGPLVLGSGHVGPGRAPCPCTDLRPPLRGLHTAIGDPASLGLFVASWRLARGERAQGWGVAEGRVRAAGTEPRAW